MIVAQLAEQMYNLASLQVTCEVVAEYNGVVLIDNLVVFRIFFFHLSRWNLYTSPSLFYFFSVEELNSLEYSQQFIIRRHYIHSLLFCCWQTPHVPEVSL